MNTFRTSSARTPREAPKVGDYRRGSRVRTTKAGTWFPALSLDDEPAGLLLLHPAVKPSVLKAVIRRLAELDLPGVLPILPDLVDQAGRNWLVATAAPTPTVADVLDDTSFGTSENAVTLSTAVAATLLDVHTAGIAHGAVGAHAVVLTADGGPMLADWGLDEAASPNGDIAGWCELAELLAERWCADSPAEAALLARAVNAADAIGPGGGLVGALGVLTGPERSPHLDARGAPVEPAPVAAPPPGVTRPAAEASSRVQPAELAPPSAQRYVSPPVAPPPVAPPPVEPTAVELPSEPFLTAPSPRPTPQLREARPAPPTPEPRPPSPRPSRPTPPPPEARPSPSTPDPRPPSPRPTPRPSPSPSLQPPMPEPTAPETQPPRETSVDMTAPLPRAPAALPLPAASSDGVDRPVPGREPEPTPPGRSRNGLARPALLTVLLTVILVTAVALIIRPFDTKAPPPTASSAPMEIRDVSVAAQLKQSICVLVANVTTNGQPGRLVYRWVGENGAQAVSSVTTAGYNYQMEIGLIWSPSSPPLHGSSVTLQILEPQPSTTSAVVPIGCI